MTRRVPETSLDRIFARHHRAVRNALVARVSLRAAAAVCAVVTLAVLIGVAIPPGPGLAWVRSLLTAALGVSAVTLAVLVFQRTAPAFEPWLEGVERHFPELRSWLRNALDLEAAPPPDTSPVLARALADETARRLSGTPIAALTPRTAPRRPLIVIGAALLATLAIAWWQPARTERSWATLWDPSRAAPPVRLVVEPGSVKLSPGAALAVRARVWGTSRAPALLRDGQPAIAGAAEGSGEGGERLWRFDLTQLTREQDYRVRVASTESPRYRISLAGEPVPVSFDIEYQAPAYARLPVQRGAATRGDLTALRGSRARLRVTFDRDLTALEAALPGGGTARWREVTPRRWEGDVPVERDGEYALRAVADRGEASFRYRITPLADAPPLIAVRLPGGDVDLPAGQRIPVEVFGQDDLGLTQLKLQYRKDPSDAWTDLPLARFGARPREARVESHWDASSLALLPGESASFRFELLDDNTISGPGRAVSPTFQLRFPSLADLYDKVDQKQGEAQATLEKVAERAKELQKSLDKLARQVPRPAPPTSQSFERSEEMKSTLERQRELGQQMDDAAKQLRESLEQAAERKAFDEQLTRKLEELNQLMQQVQSKEFREALKRMQEAIEKMDRRALENELPQWRQENQRTLANLDRTIELIKKLREEEKLQSLAQRAEELKALQDELNRQLGDTTPQDPKESGERKDGAQEQNPNTAAQQEKAAEETEQLAQDVQESAEETQDEPGQQSLEQAAEELRSEAAPAQRDAAKQSSGQQRTQARESGKKASQSLQRAAARLRQTAGRMQQAQSDLDLAAVRRAAQDLVSLQRSSEQALDPVTPAPQRGDRQTDLSEGTSRVADSLYTLARQTPFISPKLSEALGRAVSQLSTSGRELAGGNRSRGEEAGRSAGESLNEAVLELRAAEESMCQNQGPGMPGAPKPGKQQRGESMQKLSQRQNDLNQQSRSLSRRLSEQMRMQTGDRGELERLAEEQQRIREQMSEIRRGEDEQQELLGRLDQAEREMQEVEELLRDGASDPALEEKQARILSRMLDATRSLNRRDFEPERESRPGQELAQRSPAELPPELLRESDRLRLDLLKAEADRYPAQYRAFIEAYLRSLNGSPR